MKKELYNEKLLEVLDVLFFKAIDSKNTLHSFKSQKGDKIHVRGLNEKDTWKVMNTKLINGKIDETFTKMNITETKLWGKMVNNNTKLFDTIDSTETFLDLKKTYIDFLHHLGFKSDVINIVILSHGLGIKLTKTKFKDFKMTKKEKDFLNNYFKTGMITEQKPKINISNRKELSEIVEEFLPKQVYGKCNKWFNNNFKLPGIYFVEHISQLTERYYLNSFK